MERKYKKGIMILVIAFIITLVVLIAFVKSNGNEDDQTIKCIAENSELFISKTCGHCASQKEILGEHLTYFTLIDCTTNDPRCIKNEIRYVPTWLIKGEKYTGKKSLSQLKELTGC